MSEISRRLLLTGSAAAPLLFPQQASRQAIVVPKRRLLSGRYTAESLQSVLTSRDLWRPFPTASDRVPWSGLPADLRAAIFAAAEPFLGKAYESLPATLFLEYARTGNRTHWEAVQFGRRAHLRHTVLAECLEGTGRFLDDIADGIWAICEETFWGVPAHIGGQKRGGGLPDVQEPIIDLFAAETGALLAWTDYLLGPQLDKLHPLVRSRLESEVERRLLSVIRSRHDFSWLGLDNSAPVNNWNPWIHSNLLTCALLLDADPARRAQTVYKILTSLDRFLDSYHDDGGCDEGPGYWSRAGASLFECLDLLQSASRGSVNYFDLPLVGQIGAYIYKVHIAGDWYVNFADAAAKVYPDASLLYRYGKAVGDRDLQAFGAFRFRSGLPAMESLGRALPSLFQATEIRGAEARDPLPREAWFPGIQVCAARRRANTPEGFYFAALGGHNAESHNHNDAGNFVLFLDGNPVLIDVGVELYTSKTFSAQRYDIWTMQSAFHNLPTINGVMQAAGRQFEARGAAFHSDDSGAEFSAELAAAYPAAAGVEKWLRTVRLNRAANSVQVTENFALQAANGKVELSLMTQCGVRPDGSSALVLSGGALGGGAVRIAIAGPGAPVIRSEEIAIPDTRLRAVWGAVLHRTVLSWPALPAGGEFMFTITRA